MLGISDQELGKGGSMVKGQGEKKGRRENRKEEERRVEGRGKGRGRDHGIVEGKRLGPQLPWQQDERNGMYVLIDCSLTFLAATTRSFY